MGDATMGEVLAFDAQRSSDAIADGGDGPGMRGVRYLGYRAPDGVRVFRERQDGGLATLAMRNDLRDHSPTGPEWGYGGSGPAQLALAILSDAIGEREALDHYQDFKAAVVAGLPHDRWELGHAEVRAWYEEHRRGAPNVGTHPPSPGGIADADIPAPSPGHRPDRGRGR
jgi:hypothetical protein